MFNKKGEAIRNLTKTNLKANIMKTLTIIFILSFMPFVYSQNSRTNANTEDNIELSELPEVVITQIGNDFSIYLPDRHPDKAVQELQDKFITYNLGKDYEGYDNYLVIMRNEKGTLTATYNEKGKLTRVVEKYDDIKLPNEVIYSVLKAFPGWGLVDDKYTYTQSDGDVLKKQYKIKIQNGKETKRLIVTPSGEILKGI